MISEHNPNIALTALLNALLEKEELADSLDDCVGISGKGEGEADLFAWFAEKKLFWKGEGEEIGREGKEIEGKEKRDGDGRVETFFGEQVHDGGKRRDGEELGWKGLDEDEG